MALPRRLSSPNTVPPRFPQSKPAHPALGAGVAVALLVVLLLVTPRELARRLKSATRRRCGPMQQAPRGGFIYSPMTSTSVQKRVRAQNVHREQGAPRAHLAPEARAGLGGLVDAHLPPNKVWAKEGAKAWI